MKKVLTILGILILVAGCGFGIWGTLKFRKDYNAQLQQNNSLVSQNAQVQAQIDAIGAMGVAYQVKTPKLSGEEIKAEDLKEVSVPVSINGDATITNIEDLVGKHYRVDTTTGTILTKDLLMAEDQAIAPKFPREISFPSLPVKLEVGDYVDVKFLIANGEEYVVLPHIEVEAIAGTILSFEVTEEENQLINSLIMDISQYPQACMTYVDLYLEPGNAQSTAFYPVQADMEQFIIFNPNIEDKTRCINTTMRAHIDKQLILYSSGNNNSTASNFISGMQQQLSAQLQMRNEYLQAKSQAEKDAALMADKEPVVEAPTATTPEEPEATVDLEAIE